jgi:hypothetical protein
MLSRQVGWQFANCGNALDKAACGPRQTGFKTIFIGHGAQ